MSFLRDIVTDLREKRLWPLVAALVLALVAVPVVLGRGGSAPAPAPIPLPPVSKTSATPAGTASAVRLVAPPARPKLSARAHDPFGSAGGSANPASGTATPPPPASAPAGSTPSASPAPGSGSGSGSSPATVTVSHGSAPAATPSPSHSTSAPQAVRGVAAGYRVDLSFGQAGSTKAMRDALRLRALQGVNGPLGVFLGVREKPKAAVFLLAPGTSATGDGRCRPTPRDCQVLELAKGDSEFFDVSSGAASVVQFELDVDRILPRREPTASRARQAKRHSSASGRKLMFDLVRAGQDYLSHYMYKSASGVLETHAVARFLAG